jgi:signal transduction histidine kinase
MRRGGAQWAHAAKVASGATAVVAALAVVVALVVNLMIVDRLGHEVDARLSERLTGASHGTVEPLIIQTGAQHEGDLDDAPIFVWKVDTPGPATALTAGAPQLPRREWTAGTTTLATAGSTFRFDAVAAPDGLLVAGESIRKITQARGDLLLVEALLGALLLLVTFTGSFVVGLRASAPIEQIRKRQSEFTADASHELRTPLSVIEAEVDLALSRQRDAQSYQTTLKRISSESGRLRSIVDDLLWLARADGDVPDSRTQECVDVSAVGDACVERFAAVADGASITLARRGEPRGTSVIRADTEAIDRLVSVLLDNACRYAGAGGSVEVSVTHSSGRVTLTVDDSGPGIPEEHREFVFDRFHRADDRPGGTGLGLAIADAVVRNTGGSWSIGASPLGGARMEVSWHVVAPSHQPGQTTAATKAAG